MSTDDDEVILRTPGEKEKKEEEDEAPTALPPSVYDLRVAQKERDETDRDLRCKIGAWGNKGMDTMASKGARPKQVTADLAVADSDTSRHELSYALEEIGAYGGSQDQRQGAIGGYPPHSATLVLGPPIHSAQVPPPPPATVSILGPPSHASYIPSSAPSSYVPFTVTVPSTFNAQSTLSTGRQGFQSFATPGRTLPPITVSSRVQLQSAVASTTAPAITRSTVLVSPPPTTASSEEIMTTALTDIVRILREGQRTNAPSTRGISDSVIGLKKFSGSASERDSVESWLDEFMRYSEFRSLNATDRRQLFKMLMRDGAADWLATLDATKTASWDRLLAEFKATYFKSPELKWAQARDLFRDPMRVGERVDDFVIRTRRAALRLNLGDEMLHYAIICGLNPVIRNQVLAKGVTSLDETLKMARIAECSILTDPVQALLLDTLQSNKEIARQQSDSFNLLANQIQTLLDNPEVGMMKGGRQQEGSRERGGTGTFRPSNNNQNQSVPVRDRRPLPQPTPRRVQQENYGRQQEQMNRRANQNRGESNRFSNSNPPIQPSCSNCGLRHDQGRCPAYGQTCHSCGRQGHYARACRSGRRV